MWIESVEVVVIGYVNDIIQLVHQRTENSHLQRDYHLRWWISTKEFKPDSEGKNGWRVDELKKKANAHEGEGRGRIRIRQATVLTD